MEVVRFTGNKPMEKNPVYTISSSKVALGCARLPYVVDCWKIRILLFDLIFFSLPDLN